MIKLLFKKLKGLYPDEAKEFVAEQETLSIFLNSPKREQWLKSLKLPVRDLTNVKNVIDHYAKCKVKAEKKSKAKMRKDIIKIENKCLKKIFEGRIMKIKVKGTREHALGIAKKIISKKFPVSTILDEKKIAMLGKKAGIKKKFPTDFLVFDGKNKKIVSFGVVFK